MNARVVGIYRTFHDIGGFAEPIAFMLLYGSFKATNVFYLCVVLNLFNIALMLTLRTEQGGANQVV